VDTLRVEIWSDVACPWCYIGKRRWERALEAFEDAAAIESVWRSFQLDPSIPNGVRRPHDETLATKYGASPEQVRAMNERVIGLAAAEGLHYDYGRYMSVNTVDAHRLAHLAAAHGLAGAMQERLFQGQLVEGEILDDPATLGRLAGEVGIPVDEAIAMLTSDAYAAEVRADGDTARRLGIRGVPCFVFERRFAVSGAQPAELLLEALRRADEDRAGGPPQAA
jgi:predicted DsbA family dithiol-disulfide isomerase